MNVMLDCNTGEKFSLSVYVDNAFSLKWTLISVLNKYTLTDVIRLEMGSNAHVI